MRQVRSFYYTTNDAVSFYKSKYEAVSLGVAMINDIAKSTGTVTSALGEGFKNAIYGAEIWRQFNMECNPFGILPKVDWIKSGLRKQTGLSTTYSNVTHAEGATIVDPVRPDIDVGTFTVKESVLPFAVSYVQELIATKTQDDAIGASDQLRLLYGEEFIRYLSLQLTAPAIGSALAGADKPTIDTEAFTSIDQICSSSTEATAFGNDGNEDVYGIDRSVKTYENALVKYDTAGQDLTDRLMRDTHMEAIKRGATPNLILTGFDTYSKISSIFQNFERYYAYNDRVVTGSLTGHAFIEQATPAGVQSITGQSVGLMASTLYGMTIIPSQDVYQDTNKLSRLYMLDTTGEKYTRQPKLSMAMLYPVEYHEADNPVLLNANIKKGLYRIGGETKCGFLKGMVKIRDIND